MNPRRPGILAILLAAGIVRSADSTVFPPTFRNGETQVEEEDRSLLERPPSFPEHIPVARTPPRVRLIIPPGQNYPGKPWSVWGDSLAGPGRYIFSFGDHLPLGNALVMVYDDSAGECRKLLDLKTLLNQPEGHYTPGKIHSRLGMGSDGWIYASTHRGSTQVTTDAFHYRGDWIVRCHPENGLSEVVASAPIPRHCIPCGTLDGERLIFHGGTAPGTKEDPLGIQYFAYDVRARKLLFSSDDGPARCVMLSSRSGRTYFTGSASGRWRSWDPARPEMLRTLPMEMPVRAATQELDTGMIYAVSDGQGNRTPTLYAFDTRRESVRELGAAAVGRETYIASLQADPHGRFLYYVPGAHGGADRDGGAVVQYDVQTKRRKVLAFLSPSFHARHGLTLKGTYSLSVAPGGDRLYMTWNASRGGKAWDCVVLAVLDIPASERER